jgi:RecB family exonuclease
VPDALDPLPGFDARLLGVVVHRCIEAILDRALSSRRGDSPELLLADPARAEWPGAEELEALLEDVTARAMREEGIGFQALRMPLAERAKPLVEMARQLVWKGGERAPVLGAELEGFAAIPDAGGEPREIRYRADLVEPGEEGICLTDLKTGKAPSEAKTSKTRRRHFLERVTSAQMLQAPLYQLGGGSGAVGRYLFLRESPDVDQTVYAVGAADTELLEACTSSVRKLLRAWDRGIFFPRLVSPDDQQEPRRCEFCEVAEACLRNDGSARLRLLEWAEGRRETDADRSETEEAFLGVWDLRRKDPQ